jgi:hypothetical protein
MISSAGGMEKVALLRVGLIVSPSVMMETTIPFLALISDLDILILTLCSTIHGDGIIGDTTLGHRHLDTTLGDIIRGVITG